MSECRPGGDRAQGRTTGRARVTVRHRQRSCFVPALDHSNSESVQMRNGLDRDIS
jgi:hypothetical protein